MFVRMTFCNVRTGLHLLLWLQLLSVDGATITLKDRIQEIEKDLGFTHAQEMCNKNIEKTKGNNLKSAEYRLNKLVSAMKGKMDFLTTAVTKLRDEIETAQKEEALWKEDKSSNDVDVLDCCKASLQSQECVFQPSSIPKHQLPKHFTEKEAESIRNIHNSHILPLLRQYYAKPNGAMVSFPANVFGSCDKYDPCNRTWYRHTKGAMFRPKDVVILMESSQSMETVHIRGLTPMELTKEGALKIVDSLTSDDRVAVLSFNDHIHTILANSCYNQELAVATQYNKRQLSNSISRLRGRGGKSRRLAAIQKANQYFAPFKDDSTRDKILLFLSHGSSTAADYTNITRTIQTEFSVMVHMTSIIIALQDQRSQQPLMNVTNNSQSVIVEVNSSDQIVKSVTDYYSQVPLSAKSSPVFILPYLDSKGDDVIISVCLPIGNQTRHFNGVTCVDASVNAAFKELSDFEQGESTSYAFLINHLGKVLFHPRLPEPSSHQNGDGPVGIETLERELGEKGIVSDMMKDGRGQKILGAPAIISRGDPNHDGSEPVWHESTYAWARIANTNFTVCIVFRNGQESVRYPHGSDARFIYHFNTSKYWQNAAKCCQNNRLVLRDRSSVSFPLTSFKNFYVTDQVIDDVTLYMRNQSDDRGELQLHSGASQNIRDAVAFTANILSWKNGNASTSFVWRYVITPNGVTRVYPGITLNRQYDARKRSWYQRTISNNDKLVFYGPYLDYWGSGHVISISKAICKDGCDPYSRSRPLVAVVVGDVTLYHLYDLLIQSQDQCEPNGRCVIIDNSGYVVLHYDFIYPKKGQPNIELVHISVQEPEIAQNLISEGILGVKGCLDLKKNMLVKYFWQISNQATHKTFENFMFQPIHHTNLFLIVKKSATQHMLASSAHNCQKVESLIRTTTGKEIVCKNDVNNGQLRDCKCSGPSEFNYCKNKLSNLRGWQTCLAERANKYVNMRQYSDSSDALSKPCSQVDCKAITNRSECRRTLGCMWCLQNGSGELLTEPRCIENAFCFYAILGHSGPYNETGEVDDVSKPAGTVIITSAVGSALLIVTVICITYIYWQKNKRRIKDPEHEQSTTIEVSDARDVIENNSPLTWNPFYMILCVLSQAKLDRYPDPMTNSFTQLTRNMESLIDLLEKFRDPHAVDYPYATIGMPSTSCCSTCAASTIPSVSTPSGTPEGNDLSPQPNIELHPCVQLCRQQPTDSLELYSPCPPCKPRTPSEQTCPCTRAIYGQCCNIWQSEHRGEQSNGQQESRNPRNPSEGSCPYIHHSQCSRSLPTEEACEFHHGEPLYASQHCRPRESSERTCFHAKPITNSVGNSVRSSMNYGCNRPSDREIIWTDRGPRVILSTTNFQQQRIPTVPLCPSVCSPSNSAQSCQSPLDIMPGDSIQSAMLPLFQENSSRSHQNVIPSVEIMEITV